ncbi:MAG: immunoglobulin domain-containing protein, partial [Rhodoferax sp.]|nr:immunoglobulin domain-containing protein [Rhodoferax sp.]
TTQPANQSVVTGSSATFSVTATGSAPLTYQWKKNDTNLADATSSTYTTPATVIGDNSAVFTVVVSNSAGKATSNTATLTVSAAPVAPSITSQPDNQSVITGSSATFSVAATGSAPLTYQWKKNDTNIAGATSSTYTTPATSIEDSGAVFTVVVSNSAGKATSNTATLTVSAAPAASVAPSISSQPDNQSVVTGSSATFSVLATGSEPLTYQWQKNDTNIAGATSSTYTTPATVIGDNSAVFTVVVSNSAGSVTSSKATLTVSAAPVAPAIGTQPADQLVVAPQAATFSVLATGTGPLIYQWKKDGSDIAGATSSTYTTPATAIGDNGAVFAVVVSNSLGTVTSRSASLAVTAAPAIGTQPAAQTVVENQTASFSVTATGTAPLTYQWKKDGSDIAGATSSTYTTPATVSTDNNAVFTVVVSNSLGSVTSNPATLTI